MNRLLPAALVLLAVGCNFWNRPTPTTQRIGTEGQGKPTQPETPPNPDAWRKATKGPYTAEVVSVEYRPMLMKSPLSSEPTKGPESLIIRVRFSVSTDTLDTSGWSAFAGAVTDDYGNSIESPVDGLFVTSGEPSPSGPLLPKSPADDYFVFKKPIPKATSVHLKVKTIFPNAREKEAVFKFTVPLPPAE